MKTLLISLIGSLLLFIPSFGQITLSREWVSFHNGALNGFDKGNALVVDNNGNVYVTGQSFQNSSNGSITTVMYDGAGNMMWTDYYKGAVSYVKNSGEDICLDPFGNVLVTGTVAMNAGDLSIAKYNQQGRIWAMNKEPWWQASDADFAKEIAADQQGNIYCVASIMSIGGNLEDVFTLKCDSSGADLWSQIYSSASGADFTEGFALSPDGHSFAITNSFNFFGSATYDMQTIHYNPSGSQQWITNYNYPASQSNDYPMDIRCDASYNTWVCGSADAGSSTDMAVYKQNQYGTRLWTVTYNGTFNGNDTAIAVAVLPGNLTVVTGRSAEMINGLSRDVITTIVIDSGTVVWMQKFEGDSLGAVPTAMATDAAGNIYISGYYQSTGQTNAVVLVYDINGNLIYRDDYQAGISLSSRFNDIITDSSGFIYVTGQTATTPANSDIVTIKYSLPTVIGVQENLTPVTVQLYPNPATEELLLSGIPASATELIVSDITGKAVLRKFVSNEAQQPKINVSELPRGVYYLHVLSESFIPGIKFVIL